MRCTFLLVSSLAVSTLLACSASTSSTTRRSPASSPDDAGASAFSIDAKQAVDARAADRGKRLLVEVGIASAWVPSMAIENLWVAWGDLKPPRPSEYWKRFRDRYGLFEAPFDNGKYPLGIRAESGSVGFDCLLCHADRVAGEVVLGVGNSRLDLQGLFDDLETLAERAPSFGFPSYPIPFTLSDRTGAAGANDAMGLGLTLARRAAGEGASEKKCGYQQAPAWWTARFRGRLYLDGSGSPGSYRTMMATLLASGASFAELQARDADFADLHQYVLSIDPPPWKLTTLDPAKQARGKSVFDATCASCHGISSGPGAAYEDRIVAATEVGTDPLRAGSFGDEDARFVNATWFGANAPMKATGGYLAPPLRGVWASAPYFHNGSVPDLASVLDSKKRPARWKRTGSEAGDYDPERVGWRFEEPAGPTSPPDSIEHRAIVDTTRAGMRNAGHIYGDDLSESDRADLLEYLRGL